MSNALGGVRNILSKIQIVSSCVTHIWGPLKKPFKRLSFQSNAEVQQAACSFTSILQSSTGKAQSSWWLNGMHVSMLFGDFVLLGQIDLLGGEPLNLSCMYTWRWDRPRKSPGLHVIVSYHSVMVLYATSIMTISLWYVTSTFCCECLFWRQIACEDASEFYLESQWPTPQWWSCTGPILRA